MADKSISIILRVKSAIAAGLGKAWGDLKKFGAGVARVGKQIAKGMLVAGAAIAGMVAKALSSYAQEERAERDLVSSLQAFGEASKGTVEGLKEIAAQIQNETAVGDENTISRMARMRLLGVETDMLGDAAKAVIALAAAGMEEDAAMKAVAAAQRGNFDMLTRYLPALKTARSETEKAAIVNDFLSRGYAQSKAQLDTVGGAWAVLEGRVGDVWEELGKIISQNAGVKRALQQAAEGVRKMGVALGSWASAGGVSKMIGDVKRFAENIRHFFADAGNKIAFTWYNTRDVIVGFFRYIENIAKGNIGVLVARFKYFGDYVAEVWETVKHPIAHEFAPPSTAGIEAAQKALSDTIEKGAYQQSEDTAAAAQVMEDEYTKHFRRIEEIDQETNDAIRDNAAETTGAIEGEVGSLVIAYRNLNQVAEDLRKTLADLYTERESAARDAAIKAMEDEIRLIEEKIAAQQKLADMTVQEFLEQQKARKAQDRADAKDNQRELRLRQKMQRGTKLSRADQDFLKAREAVFGAKGNIAQLNPQLAAAKEQLAAMQDQGKKLVDIDKGIADTNRKLAELFRETKAYTDVGEGVMKNVAKLLAWR